MTGSLVAVVLDVDGTLVDSERDGHRVAFNRAFEELGLPYRWEVEEYGRLLAVPGGEHRLHAYLEAQGVPPPERAEIVPRLHARKTQLFRALVAGGAVLPRPGVARLLDELAEAGVRLAVATTGTRAWVAPLLDGLFGSQRFEVVVTGEDTPARKPDPSCHQRALALLGVGAEHALAVEDSEPGLAAAVAAGLACVVVTNDYTGNGDYGAAALVLDGFGDDAHVATVTSDPHGVGPPGRLDVATLRRTLAAAYPAPRNGASPKAKMPPSEATSQ